MITDSVSEQAKALEELVEILSGRRRVPSGIERNIHEIGRSARPLFAPELQPYFDQIWDVYEKLMREGYEKFRAEYAAYKERVRQAAQEFHAKYREFLDWKRSETPEADLLRFLFERLTDEDRDAIVGRLAKHFVAAPRDRRKWQQTEWAAEWKPAGDGSVLKGRRARECLEVVARARGKDASQVLADEILPGALIEAESRRKVTQRIWFKRKRIKGSEGELLAKPDEVFESADYVDYLFEESLRIVCASLLDEPYPLRSGDALSPKHRSRHGAEVLLSQHDHSEGDPAEQLEADDLLRALEGKATQAERRVLEAVMVEPDRERAAEKLGVTRGAIDVYVHRLRGKLRALGVNVDRVEKKRGAL